MAKTTSLSNKVSVPSLVDVVTQRVEEAIMSGELEPGMKIREQTLARALGVSRGPMREAIRRLEGRKLVTRTPNIGVHITSLSHTDLMDLLVVREALEGIACRIASQLMSDADISSLRALLERHTAHKTFRQGKGYYQESHDFDFHFRIVKASGNERLIEMLCDDLYHLLRVYRYKSSTKEGRAQAALKEHEDIVAALESRDEDRAEAAMRAHLRSARAHIQRQWEIDNEREASPVAAG